MNRKREVVTDIFLHTFCCWLHVRW